MSGRDIALGLLALVAAERAVELAVSSRNARRALARGAVETGRGHHRAMVLFHAGFLLACAAEPLVLPRPWPRAATLAAAVAVLGSQALRWWVVATLGERWSTRILVVPGAPPVVRGPFRALRHPNYLAVIVELVALPLSAGAVWTALAATLGNALLLAIRIPAEERALGAAWSAAFAGRPRLVPGRPR